MKDIFEILFYVGGSIILWGKIGSIIAGLGLVMFGCYRFHKMLEEAKIMRRFACQ